MTWLTPWRRREVPAALGLFDRWLREMMPDDGSLELIQARNLPRADIAETDKDLLVTLELPGIQEQDVEVRIAGNQLIVSGERKQKKEEKDKHYHRIESVYGAFERRFELPPEVRRDAESVKATFSKGLLEVRLPKAEPKPTAKIPIRTG